MAVYSAKNKLNKMVYSFEESNIFLSVKSYFFLLYYYKQNSVKII